MDVAVLYINLAQAERRRRHIEEQLQRHLPAGAERHRIPGVDGRVVLGTGAVPVSPHARLLIAQPDRACSHSQINDAGMLGCSMSHLACWRWLLDTDRHDAVLILEDDACFEPHFDPVWRSVVQPLLRVSPEERHWDVLLLGFLQARGTAPVVVHGVALRTLRQQARARFFGTHGYVVTRRGAERLLQHALPLELQTDAYLLTLQQLGLLRLFLPGSGPPALSQGVGALEGAITHHFVEPVPGLPAWRLIPLVVATSLVVLLGLLLFLPRCRQRQRD